MRAFFPAILLALGFFSPARAEDEPTFCGKTVAGWVEVLRDNATPGAERRRAIFSLGCLGPKSKAAVPVLVEEARQGPLEDVAVDALALIGEGAEVTVPNLIQRFVEEGCMRLTHTGSIGYSPFVRDSLVRIGPPAVPALREILEGPNPEMRVCAAEVLGDIGPDARAAVPALIRAVEDLSQERYAHALHWIAVRALGKIGPDAKAAVPALTGLMIDKEGVINSDVVAALTSIGVPPVQELIEIYVRHPPEASFELRKLGPQARQAVPVLRAALGDKRQQIRINAAIALARIDPSVEEALTALIDALKPPIDVEVSLNGVPEALVLYGPKARAAIPALVQLVKQESYLESAMEALLRIDPENEECIPTLIQALKNEDSYVVYNAADCLGVMGPRAKAAVPALTMAVARDFPDVDFSNGQDPNVNAAKALRRIGPAAKSAIPTLIAALKYRHKVREDVDCNAAVAAAQVLGSFGADAKSAVPALIQAVQAREKDDASDSLRRAAILALGQIGPDATAAVPVLRGLMHDEGTADALRPEALIALSRLTPDGKDLAEKWLEEAAIFDGRSRLDDGVSGRACILGALGRTSPEGDWLARKRLEQLEKMVAVSRDEGRLFLEGWFEILGDLGHAAGLAIPRLNELRTNPDPWIRMWAAETLDRIQSPVPR